MNPVTPEHVAIVRLLDLPALGSRRLLTMMRDEVPTEIVSSIRRGRIPEPFREFARAWRDALELDMARRSDADVVERLGDTRVVSIHESDYPERLRLDIDPPPALFVRGDVTHLHRTGVAIVGTRHATEYGRTAASELGRQLSMAGVNVVSGLALGVDAAAHRGVMSMIQDGGPAQDSPVGVPVGVVASGLDVVYPRANGGLWQAVARVGVVIGESPPGTAPDRFRFPLRNRIIAALSHAVVVVESRATGGSMITVDEALKRDVPVMAVPGATTTRASDGTNQLLRDGALVATSCDDVLALLGLESIGAYPAGRDLRVTPRGPDADVLAVFGHSPLNLDQVVAECSPMTLGEVALSLGRLESWGWLRHTSGWFERVTRVW
ncbi:MAG: processing protein DprA [Actinomycetota bacterium]|jgi:DNA processing protein